MVLQVATVTMVSIQTAPAAVLKKVQHLYKKVTPVSKMPLS